MAFCSGCGTQIPPGAAACPKCGKAAGQSAGGGAAATPGAPAAGLADNVAGMLAYITIIPAIIFLVIEPFNRNRFVRFHAFQSIFFCVAWTVLWIAMSVIGMIPVLGWATILVWPLLGLGGLILWVLLLAKAYGGQMFKLPVIGDMAEKQAGG